MSLAPSSNFAKLHRKLFPYNLAVWFFLVGAGSLLLLVACGDRELPPPPDPFAKYRPAMKDSSTQQLDELAAVPQYDLTITINPEEKMITGTARILVPNNSPDPWNELYFRLYPNLEQYGGLMSVRGTQVNDKFAPFVYDVESTAVRIDLTTPILAGQRVWLSVDWEVGWPVWSDNSSIYALFGQSQNIVTLPLFYPALAVYQPSDTGSRGEWWLEMGSVRGDAAYNVASLFVVTATMPADQVPVTGATLISRTLTAPMTAQYVWTTGPVREFFLSFSSQFSSAMIESYGTRVVSYWLPEDEAAGRAALHYAIAALRIYSDFYGEYPFRDLVVVPGPLSYRGMEYPGLSQIGTELYSRSRDQLEILVAHEIAHQWWYQIVHNDPVKEPWLDEAIAEYSVKLYTQKLRGPSNGDALTLERWLGPFALLKSRGADDILDRGVDDYADASQYETIVYGKGALFYDELRDTVGDRTFFRFLQQYLAEHRYEIVTSADWLREVEKLGKPELVRMYREWIGAPRPITQESGPDSNAESSQLQSAPNSP